MNLPHDELPDAFSDKNYYSEDPTLLSVVMPSAKLASPSQEESKEETPSSPIISLAQNQQRSKEETPKVSKNWILSYVDTLSGEEEEGEEEEEEKWNVDELLSELDNTMREAAAAKANQDKATQSAAGKKIRELKEKLNQLQPEGGDLSNTTKELPKQESSPSEEKHIEEDLNEEGDLFGGNLFDETATESVVTESKPTESSNLKDFSIGKWTGKTPRQLLEEFCRKNFQGCDLPKYERNFSGGNVKATVKVFQPRRSPLTFESIPCRTLDEARNYAATLALWQLSPTSPLYRLLPPPFRDEWLGWLEEEAQKSNALSAEEQKVREDFLHRMLQAWEKKQHTVGRYEEASGERQEEEREALEDSKRVFESQEENVRMKQFWEQRKQTKKWKDMLSFRESLPVWNFRQEILSSFRQNRVLLIAGETGCGTFAFFLFDQKEKRLKFLHSCWVEKSKLGEEVFAISFVLNLVEFLPFRWLIEFVMNLGKTVPEVPILFAGIKFEWKRRSRP